MRYRVVFGTRALAAGAGLLLGAVAAALALRDTLTAAGTATAGRLRRRPAAYAAAGIPVCLLVDRDRYEVVVHTNPDQEAGRYRDLHTASFGEEVVLPEPVGFALETETLKNYAR
ncbi:hypothetical protein [Streptomyces qinglanensis]|uniref:hypothetical protein n=1 Tax=Streptomyces qinglanensis TaxID=943816 RepID=UPI003D70728B